MTVLAALAAASMHAPAAALADSSPSAGDNQYTDPLATPPATTPALKQATAATSTAPATLTQSAPALTPSPPSSSTPAAPAPAASTTTTTSATSTSSSPTLPFTGFDAWFAAALGAAIAAAGTVIRRHSA